MSNEITLKDGRIAVLTIEPKGRHAAKAGKIANNDQNHVPAAIVAQVVEIRDMGNVVNPIMEDILDLHISDYFAVITLVMGTKGNNPSVVLTTEPKGRHAVKAAQIADNNQDYVPAAIAAQVVEINGVGVTMEEVLDLHVSDYFAVITLAMGTEGNDPLAASK